MQPSVALFDLDFSTGACGHYLNLLNEYDLQPVIANPSRVDMEFIDIVKKKHERGFSLLSFKQPSVMLSPKGGELVLRMLDVVSFQNNHTVIDIPTLRDGVEGRTVFRRQFRPPGHRTHNSRVAAGKGYL